MKFTYGFVNKTVKNRMYTYFWKYNGTGHKIETYIGPADKPKTERLALQIKLEYLQSLQTEITATIQETQQKFAQLSQEPKSNQR